MGAYRRIACCGGLAFSSCSCCCCRRYPRICSRQRCWCCFWRPLEAVVLPLERAEPQQPGCRRRATSSSYRVLFSGTDCRALACEQLDSLVVSVSSSQRRPRERIRVGGRQWIYGYRSDHARGGWPTTTTVVVHTTTSG